MSAIIPELKLIYVSIPKCACTSLKNCMYYLENKFDFKTYKNNGNYVYIHKLYPSIYFEDFLKKIEKYDISSFTKICLIRDPIQRFISAYTNRVMHHKELSIDKMKANNLDPEMANPNFVKYVRKFKTYRKIQSIRHHTDSICNYIGDDPSFYDKIYNINNIDEISTFLKNKYDIDYKIPKLQTGGGGSKSIEPNKLKEKHPGIYKKIEEITAKDYSIYSKYL